jgi:hypothetical protein
MTNGLPRFEYTWTFGNTLTLVAMLLGGVGVYTNITASIRVQEQALLQYRDSLTELRSMVNQTEVRTRTLELNNSRIDEKLVAINASLQRIEAALSGEQK